MRTVRTGIFGVAALALALAAQGAEDNMLLRHSFDTDSGDWKAEASNAVTVGVTKTAANLKAGGGALEVRYTIEEKQFSSLTLEVKEKALAKMKQMRFWLKTDHSTPVIVGLYEKEGGHYYSALWSPKETWQNVILTPADFLLATDKNDPPDPNNKLDLDQIEKVVIVDMANLVIQQPENPFLKVEPGPRVFWLDEFEARSDALETPPPAADKSLTLDDFKRDFLTWIPIAEITIALEKSGKPIEGHSLRAEYTQEKGKFAAVTRGVNKDLSKYKQLAFDIASKQGGKFMVNLEEKGGARYQAMIEIEGDSKVQHKTLAFSDFTLAQDSPADSDNKLSLDSLKMVSLIDLAFIDIAAPQKNTLWLANLRALP